MHDLEKDFIDTFVKCVNVLNNDNDHLTERDCLFLYYGYVDGRLRGMLKEQKMMDEHIEYNRNKDETLKRIFSKLGIKYQTEY